MTTIPFANRSRRSAAPAGREPSSPALRTKSPGAEPGGRSASERALKAFDRKFGPEFVAALPACPGVYRVYDAGGALIYVGKAKNLRRRLSQYRNAKRRKAHLKMRKVVAEASRIEVETCLTEGEALLLENRLIQQHRPKWNVAGAFFFLYPMLGVRHDQGYAWFCYTTQPELYPEFRFHGAFRSREVTREAFHALMELLEYVGHPVPWKKLQPWRRDRFTLIRAFRQIPSGWVELLEMFYRGESRQAVEELVLGLVENAGARRRGREIQASLALLERFWRHEVGPLASAIRRAGEALYPVPQKERDRLFLRQRYHGQD